MNHLSRTFSCGITVALEALTRWINVSLCCFSCTEDFYDSACFSIEWLSNAPACRSDRSRVRSFSVSSISYRTLGIGHLWWMHWTFTLFNIQQGREEWNRLYKRQMEFLIHFFPLDEMGLLGNKRSDVESLTESERAAWRPSSLKGAVVLTRTQVRF